MYFSATRFTLHMEIHLLLLIEYLLHAFLQCKNEFNSCMNENERDESREAAIRAHWTKGEC